jgi:hypothetical protein
MLWVLNKDKPACLAKRISNLIVRVVTYISCCFCKGTIRDMSLSLADPFKMSLVEMIPDLPDKLLKALKSMVRIHSYVA